MYSVLGSTAKMLPLPELSCKQVAASGTSVSHVERGMGVQGYHKQPSLCCVGSTG